jgi:quercetin dioxygenase-like cupin family protein
VSDATPAAAFAGFAAFEAEALADGFDEVLVREWAPGLVLETHTHPFALRVHVERGTVALSCGGQTRQLQGGERFELPFEAPHAEAYGPEGATFWVARRRPAAAAA